MTYISHPPAISSSPVDPATPNPEPYFTRKSVGGKDNSCLEPVLLVSVRYSQQFANNKLINNFEKKTPEYASTNVAPT